jgi:hypothetical protein
LNTFIDRCSSSLAVEDEAKPLPLLSRHTLEASLVTNADGVGDALALENLLQMAPSLSLPGSIDLPALGSPTQALLMSGSLLLQNAALLPLERHHRTS